MAIQCEKILKNTLKKMFYRYLQILNWRRHHQNVTKPPKYSIYNHVKTTKAANCSHLRSWKHYLLFFLSSWHLINNQNVWLHFLNEFIQRWKHYWPLFCFNMYLHTRYIKMPRVRRKLTEIYLINQVNKWKISFQSVKCQEIVTNIDQWFTKHFHVSFSPQRNKDTRTYSHSRCWNQLNLRGRTSTNVTKHKANETLKRLLAWEHLCQTDSHQ